MRHHKLVPVLFLASAAAAPLPVIGLHLGVPKPQDVPLMVRFIKEALPREGVNTLVIEIGYAFQFKTHPELVDELSLSRDDIAQIVAAAKEAGVRVIPEVNLLGHQSWAKKTNGLLRSHPELDETPGKYPNNEGIYCRSYCPLHPELHPIVFDLIDELTDAFHSDVFHAGMDEVFILADEDCPRCKGKLTSDLFAGEVRAIRDHLAQSNRHLWIWGDRLLDGATTGAGKWEGSYNGTWPAIDLIPRDVTICDWHYDEAIPGAALFAMRGLNVISCPWRKPEVARAQVRTIRDLRDTANPTVGNRAQGVMQTIWADPTAFIRAYFGEKPANAALAESLQTFRAMTAEVRAK